MINVFKMKKWAALVLMGVMPAVSLGIGFFYYGLWWSLAFLGVGVLTMSLVCNILLKNPFSEMLEGNGLLCFDVNSTGVVQPFILSLNLPFVHGMLKNKLIKDVWDRASTFSIAAPKKIQGAVKKTKDKISIKINQEEYSNSKYGFMHYPLLIYNSQLQSLITKGWLSKKENTSFIKHHLLYTNRQLEDLNTNVRDFGRYVVESLKPITGIFKSKAFWIILIVVIVIFLLLFGKPILDTLTNSFAPATQAINDVNAASAQSITIKN